MRDILFFDGTCNLCNSTVDFLIRRDHGRNLHFAALQGDTAKKLLPPGVRESLDSVVLWREGVLFRRSSAVLRAVAVMGGFWLGANVFLLVPPWIRNGIYDWLARNRIKWFGKRDACRLPTPEEGAFFLP